jgi:hypothetical protein
MPLDGCPGDPGFLSRNAFAFNAMIKGWRGKMVDRLNEGLGRIR